MVERRVGGEGGRRWAKREYMIQKWVILFNTIVVFSYADISILLFWREDRVGHRGLFQGPFLFSAWGGEYSRDLFSSQYEVGNIPGTSSLHRMRWGIFQGPLLFSAWGGEYSRDLFSSQHEVGNIPGISSLHSMRWGIFQDLFSPQHELENIPGSLLSSAWGGESRIFSLFSSLLLLFKVPSLKVPKQGKSLVLILFCHWPKHHLQKLSVNRQERVCIVPPFANRDENRQDNVGLKKKKKLRFHPERRRLALLSNMSNWYMHLVTFNKESILHLIFRCLNTIFE